MNRSLAVNTSSDVYLLTSNLDVIAFLAVLATLLTTFVMLSNVTLVAAMFASREVVTSHNDHNITKLLMASMACVDIVIGSSNMSINVLQLIFNGKWILGKDFCNIFHDISNASCSANACHILCIAVDKYLAVSQPLLYRVLTKRIGYFMVILSWTLPSTLFLLPLVTDWFGTRTAEMADGHDQIISCVPVFNKDILLLLYALGFYLPITITYILYALIFAEIWNFNKRKYQNSKHNIQFNVYPKRSQCSAIYESDFVSCTSNQPTNSASFTESLKAERKTQTGNSTSNRIVNREISGRISRNIKAIRTLGTIIVCFSVCWTPVWISSALYVYKNYSLPYCYIFMSGWIAYLNSAINPVLCSFFKPIRKNLIYLLCNKK